MKLLEPVKLTGVFYCFTLKIKNMGKNVHVLPKGESWAVKTEKSEKSYRVTKTQKEAIEIAKNVAINQKSELLIHGKDNKIREKNSYGNDEYPPKG